MLRVVLRALGHVPALRAARNVFRRIARARGQSLEKVASHSYLGIDFTIALADSVSADWYDKDWLANKHTEFDHLKRLEIPDTGLVFDVGAHQGVIAMILSRLLVPRGNVIAVELDEFNVRVIRRNLQLNNIKNVAPLHAGVSEKAGQIAYEALSNSYVLHPQTVLSKLAYNTVPAISIDEMSRQYGRPDLIYIDIEGHEVAAMRGAKETLREPTRWYVELHGNELCSRYGGTNEDVVRQFLQAGLSVAIAQDEYDRFTIKNPIDEIPTGRCFLIAALLNEISDWT
jgi:FkbM family methyltransferase